jgi:hypothetical protein
LGCWSDEVNHNIAQSEIEGGVHLEHLPHGGKLEIQTQHRWYAVINCGGGWVLISGDPEFLPLASAGQGAGLELGWLDAQGRHGR